MRDRFDLEEALMVLAQTSEDLDLITDRLIESDTGSTTDAIANVLTGLSALHTYRFEKTFDIFEEMLMNGHFKQVDKYIVRGLPEHELEGDKDE
jgi:phage head maturation protease